MEETTTTTTEATTQTTQNKLSEIRTTYSGLCAQLGEKYYHLQLTSQHINDLTKKMSELYQMAQTLEKVSA